MPMNPSQARVVDQILSTTARGFIRPGSIHTFMFPQVIVPFRGGKRIAFDKSDFVVRSTRRAPGARAKEVRFGHEGEDYALDDHSLDGLIPIEELQESRNVPDLDQLQSVTQRTMNVLDNGLEKEALDLLGTAGSYAAGHSAALSGNSQWSDYTNSNPAQEIEARNETVRQAIGLRCNRMTISSDVYAILRNHPDVIDRIKSTKVGLPSLADIAAYFDMDEVRIARSIYAEAPNSAGFTDMFTGKVAIAYVPPSPPTVANAMPSFGYTYTLRGYPVAYRRFWDQARRSWVVGHDHVRKPLVVGDTAGFLLTGVIA